MDHHKIFSAIENRAGGTREFIGAEVMDAEHIGAHQPDESVPVVNLVHLCQELAAFLTD